MELKQFQLDSLKVLGDFFSSARLHGAKTAFEDARNNAERAGRPSRYRASYKPLRDMDATPSVCLRLPTGGGKTILAAHAIKTAQENWLETEFPLVLWLVPTKTIHQQTVEALRKAGHPYREALEDTFGGAVRVFDISDFTQILPHDLRSACCVVVGTYQSLNVTNTEGRKVYAHNENLEPHFTGPSSPSRLPGGGTGEAGGWATAGFEVIEGTEKPKFSFANLLHWHRPLVIMDEAHQFVTPLAATTRKRINPAACIELTATPDETESNVLYAVSAQEVKDAELIKLPIVLSEHPTWEQAVTGAIARRAELATIAAKDRDYVRPIVLFQAQDKNQPVNVTVLKEHLIKVENIDERHIAVATGSQRELDGINLFDANSPIDYIITVEALKEGWDCSFAYVFCSLANVRAGTAAEQLLGRVLRMPYAKLRKDAALNRAYANLVSPQFMQAARDLRDTLIQGFGFEQTEATQSIEAGQADLLGGLFDQKPRLAGTMVSAPLTAEQAGAVAAAGGSKLVVDPAAGQLVIRHFLTEAEKAAVRQVMPEAVRPAFDAGVETFEAENRHLRTPAEKGEDFVVPALVVWVQGELEFADSEVLMENTDWRLSDHPARLTPEEFAARQSAQGWVVDLSGGQVTVQHTDEASQLQLDLPVEGWTEQSLVRWLDRQVRDPNVGQADLLTWLDDAVRHLTGPRGIPLSALKQCQYPLMRALRDRIAAVKATIRHEAYQASLFGAEAKPQLSLDTGFRFFDGMFGSVPRYAGGTRFGRHFLGWDNVPAFDGIAGGQEETCATMLDSLREVKHWVRNVANHAASFRLPTATGWFYPDFVAQLEDGRFFVVEFKGEHITESQRDKRAIGEKWGSLDPSRALFLWVEWDVAGKNPRDQMAGFRAAHSAS